VRLRLSVLAALFLPFLPAWARSPLTLTAQREGRPEAAA
jgi:hypothetical protein